MAQREHRKPHDAIIRDLVADHPEFELDIVIADRKRALGRALWEHFVRSGLSKAELARRMRTSVASVNRLFHAGNYGACTATTLIKFEIATGTTIFVDESFRDPASK